MSDMISRSKEILLNWWVMGFWCFFFTISSLGTAILAVSYTMRWAEVDWQDRIMGGLFIICNWANTMMAFLSKASSRLQQGYLPIETGDTQLIQRTTVATAATTTVEKGP